jgi:PAS domain-containing protein
MSPLRTVAELSKARLKAAAPALYDDLSWRWHGFRQSVVGSRFDWKIAIYAGDTPQTLQPLAAPAITRHDVTDVPAEYVADPFLVRHEGTWHLFFEVLNRRRHKGEIALATSDDLRHWRYRQVVISEPYHMSYPYVFRHGGRWCMTPETFEAGAVLLYEAVAFPLSWRPVARLLKGEVLLDPSPFQHERRWWMFAETNPAHRYDTLRLYGADALTGPWTEHPCSPIVAHDRRRARPAGRVVAVEGRLWRLAQTCEPEYGVAVEAFAIDELTPLTYRETPLGRFLSPAQRGWNRHGMHHVDLIRTDIGWAASVDGR